MRLEQLYIFEKVADTGSMRKAAEALYLSAQSVSKSMLQLEAEWNAPLFLRSRTGIELTAEGEQAYVLVRKVLEDVAALNTHFHVQHPKYQEQPNRTPVSLCSCAVMELFAFGTVNTLMEKYPEVPIQIDKRSSVQIRELLFSTAREEKLPDLVLNNETPAKMGVFRERTEARYNCYVLFEDELCLQVPQNDPLAALDRVPLSVLEDLPMLLFSGTPDRRTESEEILKGWGHELRNVSRISNIETCSQIALNHHRYCFVGFPSVEFRPLAGVVYVPLERPIVTNQLMLVKRRKRNRVIVNAFVRSMEDYFNLHQLW